MFCRVGHRRRREAIASARASYPPSPLRPADPDVHAAQRDRAVARLQALVRIPTVSRADAADEDTDAFEAFLAELRAQFPLLHERLELTPVTDHGLLFRWAGRDAARPVVLMAHLDVVPVDGDATWQHPPFGADIVDGEIWGRGTLDDKGSLAGICEAVERLLERDFVPAQDVWLSFGCDEEVMGVAAPAAVAILRDRGVTPVVRPRRGRRGRPRRVPRGRAPDRGHRRHREGRHLARAAGRGPRRARLDAGPRWTPTARLARAILRLDKHPFPASAPAPTVELMRRIAPHAPAPLRPLMANAARLRPVLTRALVAAGAGVRGDDPYDGRGHHALRLARAERDRLDRQGRGQRADHGRRHRRRRCSPTSARRSTTSGVAGRASSRPASRARSRRRDDDAFRLLESTIGEVFPDAVPAPYVMMAATDSPLLHRDLRPGLPLHAVPDDQGAARGDPLLRRAPRRRRLRSTGVRWYQRLIERIA